MYFRQLFVKVPLFLTSKLPLVHQTFLLIFQPDQSKFGYFLSILPNFPISTVMSRHSNLLCLLKTNSDSFQILILASNSQACLSDSEGLFSCHHLQPIAPLAPLFHVQEALLLASFIRHIKLCYLFYSPQSGLIWCVVLRNFRYFYANNSILIPQSCFFCGVKLD